MVGKFINISISDDNGSTGGTVDNISEKIQELEKTIADLTSKITPILEEDVHLQRLYGSYDAMELELNPRQRLSGQLQEFDEFRQKDFNSKLVEDLYREETFWGTIEVDSDYNFYNSPTGLSEKKERFFGRTIVANDEGTILIPANKSVRILKRSDASKKLTISTRYGQEKEYVGSPAGTVFLVTPVFNSRVLAISEVRPFGYEEISTN